ncbi:hypothetical protein QEN58_06105 [Halomonas alkaliantarctica]|uniref:Uncharacterized protein n=1 Tax=Halomonas alkaliantarctica TaxID=232346 RepID=A0ABY8LRZ9_9GAMM|nr:hypothetical protein [Halomonas alkaliantarctica]WGI26631.1 hypothetical protein QEN58_06105 [Halomonas alkaliantarctica]
MTFLSRLFSHVSIQQSKSKNIVPVFLNIIMTDVRPVSAQQKLKSFYTIIDRCLKDGREVNLVIILGKNGNKNAVAAYEGSLNRYLKEDGFNIVFVKPISWVCDRLFMFMLMAKYFTKINGSFAQRFNFACLSSISRVRISLYQKIYSLLPCNNWLGLTGGIELPALQFEQQKLTRRCIVNALQFGQASYDQQHFSGYGADNLFVYDVYSKKVFMSLNVNVDNIIVSGSPEFEYDSSLMLNEKLLEENKLSIIFVDQPIRQRGEYSEEYIGYCYDMLKVFNNDPEINFKIKKHPRGSAFEDNMLDHFTIVKEWGESLSKAHVVIGFFSNLCDFALCCGRITFYLGSRSIMGGVKCDWIVSQGGYVVSEIDFLFYEIGHLKKQTQEIAKKIISNGSDQTVSPSDIIYKRMVAHSEA